MGKIDYSNYNARKDGEYGEIWTDTDKCVFCDLKEKYIVDEKDGIVLTVNLFPYYDGHLMIIPRRHFEKFDEVTPKEWVTMQELAKIGIKLLREKLGIEDVWVLFRAPGGNGAGKSVKHAHMHLVPYEKGCVEWRYGEITISPEEMARRLRHEVE